MSQMPFFTKLGPKLHLADISEFENEIGYELPADYREFLLRINGGFPSPANYLYSGMVCELFEIFPLISADDLGLRRYYLELKHVCPMGLVPIGRNHAADPICAAALNSPLRGIFVAEGWAADEEDGLRIKLLSDSFSDFMTSLFTAPITSDLISKIGEAGLPEDVTKFLTSGGSLELPSVNGLTLLEEAAKNGNLKVAKACLEKGATFGQSLHLAIRSREVDMVELLFLAGVDLDAQDKEGRRAVDLTFQSIEMKSLLEKLDAARQKNKKRNGGGNVDDN